MNNILIIKESGQTRDPIRPAHLVNWISHSSSFVRTYRPSVRPARKPRFEIPTSQFPKNLLGSWESQLPERNSLEKLGFPASQLPRISWEVGIPSFPRLFRLGFRTLPQTFSTFVRQDVDFRPNQNTKGRSNTPPITFPFRLNKHFASQKKESSVKMLS